MRSSTNQNPGKRERFLRKGRLWVPLFMMAGISLLSGSAGVQLGSWSFVGMDKLGHLVIFGLLGIAWARCLPLGAEHRLGTLLVATGLTAFFGLLDELHQYTNPLRYFEWADLVADFAGALLAATAYLYLAPLQALLEVKIRRPARLNSPVGRATFPE